MNFSLSDIEHAIETGLNYAKQLAPLAGLIGGPAGAAIGTTVGSIADMASQLLAAVENDAAIIASGDLTRIRALEHEVQTENAALIKQIAAS